MPGSLLGTGTQEPRVRRGGQQVSTPGPGPACHPGDNAAPGSRDSRGTKEGLGVRGDLRSLGEVVTQGS